MRTFIALMAGIAVGMNVILIVMGWVGVGALAALKRFRGNGAAPLWANVSFVAGLTVYLADVAYDIWRTRDFDDGGVWLLIAGTCLLLVGMAGVVNYAIQASTRRKEDA